MYDAVFRSAVFKQLDEWGNYLVTHPQNGLLILGGLFLLLLWVTRK